MIKNVKIQDLIQILICIYIDMQLHSKIDISKHIKLVLLFKYSFNWAL